jgi:glutaminase
MAVATVDGDVYGVGDCRTPFSVQSLAKVYGFALALALAGEWPWGHGLPHNPLDDDGALVTTDRLLSMTGDAAGALRDFLCAESGNSSIDADAAAEEIVRRPGTSELAPAAGYGDLDNPIAVVVEHYVRQCAITASCEDLASAALFLARGGIGNDGARLLAADAAKRINATMLMCGGEFAYRVGLPAKSGAGGGIIAVVPNRCVVCVWSPGLDAAGNSVVGVAALEAFSSVTGLSVF